MAYARRVLPQMLPVVLVHGGLYDGTTSRAYWADTGVLGELRARHLRVLAPSRPIRPRSWEAESNALLAAIDDAGHERVALIGASNGCSAAVRMTIDHPHRVERLMLAWPATAGDPVVDELLRVIITDEVDEEAADALLDGETLRGVGDAELGGLELPVVVFPSLIEPGSPATDADGNPVEGARCLHGGRLARTGRRTVRRASRHFRCDGGRVRSRRTRRLTDRSRWHTIGRSPSRRWG